MSRKQDDRPHELESQFILRLPAEQASTVREIIRSRDPATRDKLKIDLSPDARRAVVQVDNVNLAAKVVDLPCVIGSLKTHDRKTFYKTADVSQMLLCSAEGGLRSAPEGPAASARATATGGREGETEENYIWKHGVTPPLKNVRKKRFRVPTRKLPDTKQGEDSGSGCIDSKAVEKEVKRLLRSDAEAISTRWEVVVDGATKAVQGQTCIPGPPVSTEMSGPRSFECAVPQSTFCDSSCLDDEQDEDEEDEDEEDDEDEDDDDEDEDDDDEDEDDEDEDEDDDDEDKDGEDEEDDEDEEKESESEEDMERELQAKFIEFNLCEAKEGCSSVILGIQKLIHHKEKRLQQIQAKARRQKNLLRKLENATLKSHFQSVLEQLKLQEKQKYEQIIFLQQQLQYFLKK
ncbi:transcription initiation factor TFIID subunit 7-like [Mesocricetus auratus]|uniref:Transcription initiation factor TFIID subunit 7-like n=1 Tax=Mesocricetus auratus TaxID=10036 RepID=A0ABM2YAQ5_MESAU|nr:transcription initiation factor TFIID subunit 7-like [Mesocricetus auratus]